MADCSESIANQILSIADENHNQSIGIINEICKTGIEAVEISKGAMDSLFMLDVDLANRIITKCERFEKLEKDLTEQVVSLIQNRKIAVALRGVVWNLTEISRAAKMICEVAINRYLESNTEVCRFWKERKSGGEIQYLKKLGA